MERLKDSPRLRQAITLSALTGLYFVAGKLGLHVAYLHPNASPVWAPAGIALAAFVMLGYRIWPAIALGAFLVNVTTAGSVATSLGIALGNTLEGMIGAALVHRFAHGRDAFDQPYDVFKFTILTALVSTAISATVGVTTLACGGFAPWGRYGTVWLTWWLGDAGGDLVIAPLILLWCRRDSRPWPRAKMWEAGGFWGCLALLGFIVFGGGFSSPIKNYPLEFIFVPLVIWAAFRLGSRQAITATVVLAGISISGTLHGHGPFVQASPNESLLLLQAFMGVLAVTGLSAAAVVAERERAQIALRQALQTSESRLRRLLASNLIGIVLSDHHGRIWEANDAFLKMVGQSREAVQAGALNVRQMTPPEYQAQDTWALEQIIVQGSCPALEKELIHQDGRRVPVLVGAVSLEEGQNHSVSFVIDATARRQAMEALRKAYDEIETRVTLRTTELSQVNAELETEIARRKNAEDQLRELSLRDPLTGLYNRRGFLALSDQHLLLATRDKKEFLLFFIDVDGLKPINDQLGHLRGDQALIETAHALSHAFRQSDIIARIGGDEFSVVAVEAAHDHAPDYRLRLEQQLREINAHSRLPFTLSLSMGVATFHPRQPLSIAELMTRADEDLYKHKQAPALREKPWHVDAP